MIDANFYLYLLIFALTFAVTVIAEKILIPRLAGRARQPIYSDGPKWHMSKSGTPTMGGLAFLISISVTLGISSAILIYKGHQRESLSLILCLVYSILNALVGIIDDAKKLRKKKNAGLTPIQKLIFQTAIAALFLTARALLLGEKGTIEFGFGDFNLGIFYYPIALIVLVGITNCANLTDGIDGLASGVAFSVGVSLFYISYALSYDVAFISVAIMGATTGFLIFNLHPAKIFMGDTGSLFLGALGASSAIALCNPAVIIFAGGIYVIEGLSVILQVVVFKLTRKRLFKMAPIHHHLEKLGWSENRICITAIILTFILSIPAFILYL